MRYVVLDFAHTIYYNRGVKKEKYCDTAILCGADEIETHVLHGNGG